MSAVRRVAHPDEVDGEHEHMEGEGDVEEESQQVHEQELNGKVLYDLSGGTPHGRFAIANGAVRAATKENKYPTIKFCFYAKHGTRSCTPMT